MTKNKKLVIVGDGEFADIAYEYFTVDSDYEVVGFAVEKEYLKRDSFHDLPVVAFEEIEQHFSKGDVHLYVAITYTRLNQVREKLYNASKAKGYIMANYISSRAFVWRTAKLGDNVFIFEGNVVQHGVTIGNNVVLWSGNHIGHQTVIGDHTYFSSHVVVSGYCKIGQRCFLGVNATFADYITLADDCFVAMGAQMVRSIERPNSMIKNVDGKAQPSDKLTAKKYMKAE